MSSNQMEETKQSVMDAAGKTKECGEQKAGEAQQKLGTANKSDDPSFADQAKEKAQQAKEGAANAKEKVTGAIGDTWAKTKENFNNVNQYPDKK
ncbi:unnamed protein product [Calypogeia fissa]